MKRLALSSAMFALAFIALISSNCALAQSSFVAISPSSVALRVGESRTFRLVDQNGRMQHSVHWYISDPEAFDVNESDELTIQSKSAGNFQLRASAEGGEAEGAIKVFSGDLPSGTALWSEARIPGCKPVKIIQAKPTPGGPDLYDQSQCADGTYFTALTSGGVELWRRKAPANAAQSSPPGAAATNDATSVGHFDSASASACDSLSVGMSQQQVRDILQKEKIAFTNSPSDHTWIIDEAGAQCKLWFDPAAALAKKRKIFVEE